MKTVVFTNGCFDLLHPGHVHLLKEARKLGDKLVIGLNSDASIRRLKGSSRPIFTQFHREMMLRAMRCVDDVWIFEEDTPIETIREIKPDILVKGGDWDGKPIAGSDLVNRVVTIPFQYWYSTTEIIERIYEARS